MDRYDRIIRDIQKRTSDDQIRWLVVPPGSYARILAKPDRVYRAFTADYELGGNIYTLLFAEERGVRQDEYGEDFDVVVYSLNILGDDGEIVLPLYDGVVERADLSRLSGLIYEHNDRAKEFFKAFDKRSVG